jgi:predicted enzyme related to lactoylglutathione lyase
MAIHGPGNPWAIDLIGKRGRVVATITGIGGIFFRAADPAALKAWYADMLGITQAPAWQQQGGPTAFEPFPADTAYFGRPTQNWMINFRVDDLAGFIDGLRARGVAVQDPEEFAPIGWFARLADPEGNPIELWEVAPKAGTAAPEV